jgi:hypothetical protein
MAIGTVSKYNLVIASGGSASTMLDLGRGYAKVIYDCTGATDSSMFYSTDVAGGTRKLVRYQVVSGLSAPQTLTVGSACSGSLVEVTPLAGLRYVQVVVTAGVANGATLELICSDV